LVYEVCPRGNLGSKTGLFFLIFREQKTKTAKYKITENGFEVG